jgi:2-keto-4-pentenoate hydratase/2-oxohepta-3-ene-1,7-dioic acid hydratase (catechol pathway)
MRLFRIAKGERYDAPIHYAVENGSGFDVVLNPFETGDIQATGEVISAQEAQILAPCIPSKILCADFNYRDHANEMAFELPSEPSFFMKPPSSIISTGDMIIYPRQTQRVCIETELAIVIGKRAKNVMPEEASAYIFGFTVMNDITAVDIQKRDRHWSRSNGFDTFCPLGPCIVTDVKWNELTLHNSVNGETGQNGNTKDMIFGPDELISYISKVMTLMPGDVIATGTPGGAPEINRGDSIEVSIDGIGALQNRVN